MEALIAFVVGLVGYKLLKKAPSTNIPTTTSQSSNTVPNTQTLPPAPPPNSSSTVEDDTPFEPSSNDTFPLKVGSRGDAVKLLQKLLGLSQDGVFGQNTAERLKAKYGITSISESKLKEMLSKSKSVKKKQAQTPTPKANSSVTKPKSDSPTTKVEKAIRAEIFNVARELFNAMYTSSDNVRTGKTTYRKQIAYDTSIIIKLLDGKTKGYLRAVERVFNNLYSNLPTSNGNEITLKESLNASLVVKIKRYASML